MKNIILKYFVFWMTFNETVNHENAKKTPNTPQIVRERERERDRESHTSRERVTERETDWETATQRAMQYQYTHKMNVNFYATDLWHSLSLGCSLGISHSPCVYMCMCLPQMNMSKSQIANCDRALLWHCFDCGLVPTVPITIDDNNINMIIVCLQGIWLRNVCRPGQCR